MSTRFSITLLLCMLVSTVLFGVGATTVLATPALSAQASILLPAVVILSFLLAPLIAWPMAPMLRARHSRTIQANRRDRPPTTH